MATAEDSSTAAVDTIESYSLKCFVDWIDNIETNNKIIALDFDKIEKDIQEYFEKDKEQCKALFYPNKDGNDYDKDQKRIQEWYKKIFGGSESIIHYILYNKAFLFSVTKSPDIEQKEKFNKLQKNCSADLIHLNMKQNIYILRLLLLKYSIIHPNTVMEDCTTYMITLVETLKENMMDKTFDYTDIKNDYLRLIIDVSCSYTNRQSCIFNILYINTPNQYFHLNKYRYFNVNFFDNIDIKNMFGFTAKMSPTLIQTLLFRGIQPLSVTVSEHWYSDEINPALNNFDLEQKMQCLIDNVLKFDWKQQTQRMDTIPVSIYDHYWGHFLEQLRAVTAPLIIQDCYTLVQQKMRDLLQRYIKGIGDDDCIECILGFVYTDLKRMYPKNIEQNPLIKAGMYFNYILEMEKNEILNERFVTKSMAQFLFTEFGEDIQKQMFTDIFKRNNICGLKALFEVCKFQKFSENILEAFMRHMLYGYVEMNDSVKELFVKIACVNLLELKQRKNEVFMTKYREKLSDEIKILYETEYGDHEDRIRAQNDFITQLLKGESENSLSIVCC